MFNFVIIGYVDNKPAVTRVGDDADYTHFYSKALSLECDWVQVYSVEDSSWTHYMHGKMIA